MRLAIDEHMQHKDVYDALAGRAGAGDRPRDRRARTSCCGWPRCCTTSASPATRRCEPDGAGELPPPRGGRGEAGPQAAARAAVPEGGRSTRWRSWCSCTCASTATAAASGPTRRCAATSPTPGRCSTGCTSWSARTAPPATSGGRRRCSAPTTTSRRGSPRSRAQEELDAIRPDLDGNAIMELLGHRRRARWSGKAYKHLLALRMERGPLGRGGGGGGAAAVGGGERVGQAPERSRLLGSVGRHRCVRAVTGHGAGAARGRGQQAEQVHARRRRQQPRGAPVGGAQQRGDALSPAT